MCLASGGPGACHLLNGLSDARADSVPVLAITGLVPAKYRGTGYKEEFDPFLLFSGVACYNVSLGAPEAATWVLRRAMRAAILYGQPAHVFAIARGRRFLDQKVPDGGVIVLAGCGLFTPGQMLKAPCPGG